MPNSSCPADVASRIPALGYPPVVASLLYKFTAAQLHLWIAQGFLIPGTHCCTRSSCKEGRMAHMDRNAAHGQQPEQEFRMVSPAIPHDGRLPRKFTQDCQGATKDISPPLEWYGVPEGTESLALIVEDVDAPDPAAPIAPWALWVVVNIPPFLKGLPAGFSTKDLDDKKHKDYVGIVEGTNDWKIPGWRGPNPPDAGIHRHEFRLYALDTVLHVIHKPNKERVLEAMDGHILGEAVLVATYGSREKCPNSGYIPPGGPSHIGPAWPAPSVKTGNPGGNKHY